MSYKSKLLDLLEIAEINKEGDLVPKSRDCHVGDKLVCSQALICRSACESLLRNKDLQGGLLMIVEGKDPNLEMEIIKDHSKCASGMLLFDTFKDRFDNDQIRIRKILDNLETMTMSYLQNYLHKKDVLLGVLKRIPITEKEAGLWRKAYKKYSEAEKAEEISEIKAIKKIVDIKFQY